MKKYFVRLFAVSTVIAVLYYAFDNKNSSKNNRDDLYTPQSTISNEINYDVDNSGFVSVGDSVVPTEVVQGNASLDTIPSTVEARVEEQKPQLSYDQMSVVVNQQVYFNLLEAKKNYGLLFIDGPVSNLMIQHHAVLSPEESIYVDNCFVNTYNLICHYLDSYENSNIEECYYAGLALSNYYKEGLTRESLYHYQVLRRLPEAYQSNFLINEYGSIYDENGNIHLQNGNKIRLIGLEDELVGPTISDEVTFNNMYQKSQWFKNLPNIVLSEYSILNPTNYSDALNIINESKTERLCEREWASIKEDGASVYGFDPSYVHVSNINNDYYYVGADGELLGMLNSNEINRLNRLYTVQDVLISNTCDVNVLDNDIKNMGVQSGYSYSK